ncbi:MAG: hypothetical protein JO103_04965 [Candidatus Eremiobacteraeota bacterium]|nr:hypothetical protein [Candidatus Eremiobacteraeota bacterium]
MLNELMKRLAARNERRADERVRRRFPVAWVRGNELVAALGLEISEKGILFAAKEAPPGAQVDVVMELGQRRVRARLLIVRRDPIQREGVAWTLIAGTYQGIAADDWDAVVRFCRDRPEPENKAAAELAAAHSDDDAYRLLPLKVQERLVAALVAAGRLAPGSDAKSPLLRLSYGGTSSRTGQHRLSVHSRRNVDGEVLHFESTLSVDDAGNVTLDR